MTDPQIDRFGEPIVDPFPPGARFADRAPAYSAEPGAGQLRPRRRRMRPGRWVAGILAVLVIVGAIVAAPWDAQRRQAYADQWVVWTEPPPAEIEALAEELQLTETGRRIFFASRPQVESAASFQEHCPVESQLVLGCYFRKGIYIYSVTDERLAGTIEATAAHELLHAFHDRLSPDEQRRIDALVNAYVATLPETDPNVAIVAGYDESQRSDEWHSRLGTSYADLPAELEQHYAQLFLDRTRVLAFDSGSTAEFDDYASRIAQLESAIHAAYDDLETRSAAYDAAIVELNSDIESFNARADDGAFESQEQFDSEREELLDRQNALEQTRLALNSEVDSYNAMLAELRTLDAERAELYAALDSRTAP